MNRLLLLCALAALTMVSSCGTPISLEGKIAGVWRQGSREFIIKGGAIAFRNTGKVYASYEIVDERTIRFRRDDSESRTDRLLKVHFYTPDKMSWQRDLNGDLRDWWTLERIGK